MTTALDAELARRVREAADVFNAAIDAAQEAGISVGFSTEIWTASHPKVGTSRIGILRSAVTETAEFEPVATLADLSTLSSNEILAGYCEFSASDPEPGANRGRAYWHGWMNAARDRGHRPETRASRRLSREFLGEKR